MAVLAIDLVVPEHVVEPWTAAQRWETMIIERLAGFGGSVVARSPSRLIAVFGVPRALEQLPQRAVLAALSVRRLAVADGSRAAHGRPRGRRARRTGGARRVGGAAPGGRHARAAGSPARSRRTGRDPGVARGEPAHRGVVRAARRASSGSGSRTRSVRMPSSGAGRRRRRRSRAPDSRRRFVGRQRELELLRETFASAAAGHGQVVFVVGEAGLGKSRLLAELRARVAGETHCWVEGRCASYGATTAFLPVIDALRRAWGLDDQDDESGARAKVERAIARLGDEVAWTLPFVRQVLGLAADDATLAALDSATRRSEIFRALKALVLRVARRDAAGAGGGGPPLDRLRVGGVPRLSRRRGADHARGPDLLVPSWPCPPLRRSQLPRPRHAPAADGGRDERHQRRRCSGRGTFPPR